MQQTNLLQVDSLCKSYTNVQAVNRISFDVSHGDIFAFLGPNGAGKTTTLRMLLGIIKPDSGSINWGLNSQNRKPQPKQIGYLPEERGLYPDQTVIKILVYLASVRGMEPVQAKKAAIQWLEKLELADRANEKLQNLSKGNQQKVQFVASILHKPEFAILDEPFSGFDPVNQELFITFIREINEQGTTVLLSAHQMALVERIAHKIFIINKGSELFNGKLTDIYSLSERGNYINLETSETLSIDKLLLIPGIDEVKQSGTNAYKLHLAKGLKPGDILHALAGFGGIESIQTGKQSLHDIYIELVKNQKA